MDQTSSPGGGICGGGRGVVRRGGLVVLEPLVSGLLFWLLCGTLFVLAVACVVSGVLVRDHENRYLFWVGMVPWAVLCVALAWVLKARYF